MAPQPPGPALSHEELAAIDLIIMNAIQRGVKPNEPLSFIEAVTSLIGQTYPQIVLDGVPQIVNIPQIVDIPQIFDAHQDTFGLIGVGEAAVDQDAIAQAIAHVTGAAAQHIQGPAADAAKQAMVAMARVPSLTLQQLIDIRRRAAQAQSGK